MREWRQRDQLSFKKKKRKEEKLALLLVTEKRGLANEKISLQKPKRFDYKARQGGCTWERG